VHNRIIRFKQQTVSSLNLSFTHRFSERYCTQLCFSASGHLLDMLWNQVLVLYSCF